MATGSVTAAASVRLEQLPHDILLLICDHMQPQTLLSLSLSSTFWHHLCSTEVWPRRIANCLSVRSVDIWPTEQPLPPHPHHTIPSTCRTPHALPKAHVYFRILRTLIVCPSARTLMLCVHIGPADTLTSLALTYAISRHDICRANSLYAEHHLATRTHLYIPMPSEDHITRALRRTSRALTVCMVRDYSLSNKLFAVVECREAAEQSGKGRSRGLARRWEGWNRLVATRAGLSAGRQAVQPDRFA